MTCGGEIYDTAEIFRIRAIPGGAVLDQRPTHPVLGSPHSLLLRARDVLHPYLILNGATGAARAGGEEHGGGRPAMLCE